MVLLFYSYTIKTFLKWHINYNVIIIADSSVTIFLALQTIELYISLFSTYITNLTYRYNILYA